MPKNNQFNQPIHAPRFPPMKQEIAELPGPGAFDANYTLVRPKTLVSNFGADTSGRSSDHLRIIQREKIPMYPKFDGSVSPRPGMIGHHVRRYRDGNESVFGRKLFGIFQGLPRRVDNWPTSRICKGFANSPSNSPDNSPRPTPAVSPNQQTRSMPNLGGSHSAKGPRKDAREEAAERMERIQTTLKSGPLNLEQHRELFKLTSHPTLQDVQMQATKKDLKEKKKNGLA